MATIKREDVLGYLESANMLEVSALIKDIEEKFGVTAAAPAAMAVAGGAAAPTQAEEQTEFEVLLTEIGERKINVIKAVREITELGLKEAKELVDSAPKAVKEGCSKEEAEEIKAKIESAGGRVKVD